MKRILLLLSLPLLVSCSEEKKETQSTEPVTSSKLDTTAFEVIATKHNPAVENYHILIKSGKKDSASLQEFTDLFREERCVKCNINLYDDKSVTPLVTTYPLEGQDYVLLADHYLANSTFDSPKITMYPYHDSKYKELSGKNAK